MTTHTRLRGRADGGQVKLRDGWRQAAAAVAVAAITSAWIASSIGALSWLSVRLTIAGIAVFIIGLGVGSERLVGVAAPITLAAGFFSVDSDTAPAWGRSLLIGCLWYVATELAWDSIKSRGGVVRSPAVARLRGREVATVTAVSIVVGLAAAGIATVAPSRTFLIQALAVTAVIAVLWVAVRRLQRSAGEEPVTGNDESGS